jgi:hypothetical protein
LKVSAPTPQAPANGAKLEQGNPVVLVITTRRRRSARRSRCPIVSRSPDRPVSSTASCWREAQPDVPDTRCDAARGEKSYPRARAEYQVSRARGQGGAVHRATVHRLSGAMNSRSAHRRQDRRDDPWSRHLHPGLGARLTLRRLDRILPPVTLRGRASSRRPRCDQRQ